MRKHRLQLSLLGVVLIICALFLASKRWQNQSSRIDFIVFGTTAQIELISTPGEAKLQTRTLREINQDWQKLTRAWHPWQASNLTRLNHNLQTNGKVNVDALTSNLAQVSQNLAIASGQRFDPGIGRLISLWGFHSSEYPIISAAPAESLIQATLKESHSILELKISADQISTAANKMALDFNAVAEGAAIWRAQKKLHAAGLHHALINLGGDVYAMGHNFEQDWQVALRDPNAKSQAAFASARLHSGEALFSSGAYTKYREYNGERWPHVLDPRSGMPVENTLASAVIHPDPIRADAAATALMVAGAKQVQDLMVSMHLDCVLIIDKDQTLWLTRPMLARLSFVNKPKLIKLLPSVNSHCRGHPQDHPSQQILSNRLASLPVVE